jgi:hypothetical protein
MDMRRPAHRRSRRHGGPGRQKKEKLEGAASFLLVDIDGDLTDANSITAQPTAVPGGESGKQRRTDNSGGSSSGGFVRNSSSSAASSNDISDDDSSDNNSNAGAVPGGDNPQRATWVAQRDARRPSYPTPHPRA